MPKDAKNTSLVSCSYNNHIANNTRTLKSNNGVALSKGQYLAMLKRQENSKHRVNLRNINICTPNNTGPSNLTKEIKPDSVDKLFGDRTSLVNKKIQKTFNSEMNQKSTIDNMKNYTMVNHSGSNLQKVQTSNYSKCQSAMSFTPVSKNENVLNKSKKEN